MNEKYDALLAGALFAPASLICFEKPADLIDAGYMTVGELEAIKTPLDKFELINSITVRVLMDFIEKGIEFISLDSTVISPFAVIGKGTVVHPGTEIRSGVEIGENCIIGPSSVIENSKIGSGSVINASQIYSSVIGENVTIGPYSHVRNQSVIHDNVHIGDFVEVKNSIIGEGTKSAHLTYIGDADVGEKVNFGCGVVFCNYNGYKKQRTSIGNNAFIGCNTNLVAPVKVGDDAYTAAGSTITEDVPNGALAIARERQTNKEGFREAFARKNRSNEGK